VNPIPLPIPIIGRHLSQQGFNSDIAALSKSPKNPIFSASKNRVFNIRGKI